MRLFSTIVGVSLVLFLGCRHDKQVKEQVPASDSLNAGQVSSALDTSNLPKKSAVLGLEPGNIAPDLEFNNPEGKPIKLSSLRGKMVLIDFWASWCLPCRTENPNLVKVYKKYANARFREGDGFTIYSVSLDTKPKRWTEAIQQDGLSWETNVSDLKGWESQAVTAYSLGSIPANFLINGEGVIIARDLRENALETTISALVK
jgi:thiol-disulfide isomerase/thioredoxin